MCPSSCTNAHFPSQQLTWFAVAAAAIAAPAPATHTPQCPAITRRRTDVRLKEQAVLPCHKVSRSPRRPGRRPAPAKAETTQAAAVNAAAPGMRRLESRNGKVALMPQRRRGRRPMHGECRARGSALRWSSGRSTSSPRSTRPAGKRSGAHGKLGREAASATA